MQFPKYFVDQLCDRIPPSHIIGKHVKLTHKSGDEYTGLCPFHNEKTPSFTVSDGKKFYHCFGCGEHGSIIKFLMEIEGKSFADTIEYLAGHAGIPIPKLTETEAKKQSQATNLYEVMDIACTFFQSQLASPTQQHAQHYIRQRAIAEAVTPFRLGYAPNGRNTLLQHLKHKNIPESLILEAGLAIKNDHNELYDRFRNRIMFPICDSQQRVIAFGGRILGDGKPKYLNSPETPLFKKSHVLFSGPNAQKIAFKEQSVIVTEGYMDVIALYLAGIQHSVAPLGTAVTDSHLHMLWNMAKTPILCLDGDNAGKRAMEKVSMQALPLLQPGMSLSFCTLPDNMDPDDLISKHGAQSMHTILQQGKPLVDVIWDMEKTRLPLNTPEQKADFEHRIFQHISSINNQQVQHYYRQEYKQRLWESGRKYSQKGKGVAGKSYNSLTLSPEIQLSSNRTSPSQHPYIARFETHLVALIIAYPALLLDNETIEEQFIHLELSTPELNQLRTALLTWAQQEALQDTPLVGYLEQQGHKASSEKILQENFLLHQNNTDGYQEYIAKKWFYVLNLYNLAVMRKEYLKVMVEMTNEAEARALALKKQIDSLAQQVEEERMLLEQYVEQLAETTNV